MIIMINIFIKEIYFLLYKFFIVPIVRHNMYFRPISSQSIIREYIFGLLLYSSKVYTKAIIKGRPVRFEEFSAVLYFL